jgi:hypothetical protein
VRRARITAALTLQAAVALGLPAGAPTAGEAGPAARTPPPRAPLAIVVCAPGFPGSTAQARPTMDLFARAVARAADLDEGRVTAVYYETEAPGLAAMAKPGVAFALVPLPFFLKHGPDLRLEARLAVTRDSGTSEIWSLAAKKGRVTSPASLAGWEVTGSPGYAPAFVRGPALRSWGPLPETARVSFAAAPLAALRRAAAGEPTAVLLDAAQALALSSLPFAADLEIVARSAPLPGTLLCVVGDRPGDADRDAILGALRRLPGSPEGAEALSAMRMVRFDPADAAAIENARRAYAAAAGAPR